MTSGIYKITNKLNGKFYIGSSARLPERWWEHRAALRSGKHNNSRLQNAWKIYGEGNFLFEIIEVIFPNKSLLQEREQYWVDTLDPEYNICKEVVSSCLGVKRTKETKEKMKLSWQTRDTTCWRGRKVSYETRKLMSEQKIGRVQSKNQSEQHSILMSGEGNPNAVLNWTKVNEIRRLRSEENLTHKQLAELFNVKEPAIWKILNGKAWVKRIKDKQ